jgi:hypothetical protein
VANPTSVARVAPRSIGGHQLDVSAVSAKVVSTSAPSTFNSVIPSRSSWCGSLQGGLIRWTGTPYIVKPHHPPPIQHTPPLTAPPHAIFGIVPPSHRAGPLATRIFYPHRINTTTGECAVSPLRTTTIAPRSTDPPTPASQCTYPRVCLRAAGCVLAMHQCVARLAWTSRETVGVAKLNPPLNPWETRGRSSMRTICPPSRLCRRRTPSKQLSCEPAPHHPR